MAGAFLRYVVLYHTGLERPHFDLMVEMSPGLGLATWRVEHWPPGEGDGFEPLAEHRAEYLTYEGPISGNRGKVQQIAAGRCVVIQQDECWIEIEFDLADPLRLKLPRLKKPNPA
jgi:hypothetical protein